MLCDYKDKDSFLGIKLNLQSGWAWKKINPVSWQARGADAFFKSG